MTKKLIISLSIIGIIATIAIGGTIAYFSDTEISTDNTFIAGKLDLLVDSDCTYNGEVQEFCTWNEKNLEGDLFFNFDDVKPGDWGEDTVSLHIVDNDAWACATLGPLTNNDNDCNDPEDRVDGTCGNPGIGEGELGDNLYFTIWADYDCNNILDGEEFPLTEGSANGDPWNGVTWVIADSTGNVFNPAGGPLVGDATYCLGMAWSVPSDVGNVIQSDSLSGDISFYVEQARNNPDFICGENEGLECIVNEDCNDEDPCTENTCVANFCEYNLICIGSDMECGCESCEDCNARDGYYDSGDPYPCCGGDGNLQQCTCQYQQLRNYYCEETSCVYALPGGGRINKSDCYSCSEGYVCSPNGCVIVP